MGKRLIRILVFMAALSGRGAGLVPAGWGASLLPVSLFAGSKRYVRLIRCTLCARLRTAARHGSASERARTRRALRAYVGGRGPRRSAAGAAARDARGRAARRSAGAQHDGARGRSTTQRGGAARRSAAGEVPGRGCFEECGGGLGGR